MCRWKVHTSRIITAISVRTGGAAGPRGWLGMAALRMRARRALTCRLVILIAIAQCGLSPVYAGDSVERSGDIARIVLPAVALATTFRQHDAAGRPGFYKSFAAMAISTWGLKEMVSKDRPDGSGNDAFPSGHTAVAFQSAAFLDRRYGRRSALWAYALAGYVGWTRVDSDKHDAVDVLAGAAIGIGASYWLVEPRPGFSLAPMLDRGSIGLFVHGSF
jgi:membrane-associated phospholipid phosphatase